MDYSEPCQYSTRLVDKLRSLDTENTLDFDLIDKSVYWAKKHHNGQYRKSGEPFYTHPLEVAYMLTEYNLKTDVIVTAVLHDIVEDTEVTAGMILDGFGWRIAEMVDMLTRDRPDGSKLSVEEILNNAYEKNDKEVLLIKLIDRLHNMQTIGSMTIEKRKKIAVETIDYIIVMATVFQDLDLEKSLSEKVFSILYNKEEATLIMNKKYNLFSVLDSYQPPLPFFQNEVQHI